MDYGSVILLLIGVAALVGIYQLDRRRKRREQDENRRAVRDYEGRHADG